MAGLLYKDFVSIKGKKICIGMLIFLVLFTILRILFPGTKQIDDLMIRDAEGQLVNSLDILFTEVLGFLMISAGTFLNQYIVKLAENDQKNTSMNYIKSLPLKKNTYVASRYIFLLIMEYVILSYYLIISIICRAFTLPGKCMDSIDLFDMIALPAIMFMLFVAAIYLPMYLCLGYGKSNLIIRAVLILLGMGVIGFLYFGDLTILLKIDFEVIVEFMKKHRDGIAIFSIISDFFVLAMYYLSYRIACHYLAKSQM